MGDDEARRPGGGEGTAAPSGSPLLLDPGRERRYAELFQQLDLNNDGKVDIGELRTALAARGLNQGDAEEVRGEVGGAMPVGAGVRARTHTALTRERRSASVHTSALLLGPGRPFSTQCRWRAEFMQTCTYKL